MNSSKPNTTSPTKAKRRVRSGYNPMLNLTVSRDQKAYFLENLAMQLTSGIDVLSALEAIAEETKSGTLRSRLRNMKLDIDAGDNLWQAFQNSGLVKADVVSLIKIGEQVGRLPENLEVIVLQAQREHEFRSRVRSAMMYPVFVLVLTLIIGLGVAWFILPRLSELFAGLNVELPFITQVLIQVGRFFGQYGAIAVPSIIVTGILILLFVFVIRPFNAIGQWLLFNTPGIHKVIVQIELARMGYVFGSLLKAGLPITEALTSLTDSTALYRYRKFYRHINLSVTQGDSLQKAFKSYRRLARMMPRPIQQMIVSSEQSGRLPQVLLHVGEIFETKTETSTKSLTVIREPILLVIVWLGVISVAIAIILPVYSLIGQLDV